MLTDKIFIRRFYSRNAGMFLFVLLVSFGIMNGHDTYVLHRSLMELAMSNGYAFVAGMGISLLYAWKCTGFCLDEAGRAENGLLYHLQAKADGEQAFIYLRSLAAIYAPMAVYCLLAFFVGVYGHKYTAAIGMLLWQAALMAGSVKLVHNRINLTWKPATVAFRLPQLNFKKRLENLLLFYSVNELAKWFVPIKVFSILVLRFLVDLNAGKVSRENTCFTMLIAISAHALLPIQYTNHLEQHRWLRSLPIARMRYWSTYLLTYAVIFLPELLFLLVNEWKIMPHGDIVAIYLLCISMPALFTALQYVPRMNMEMYTGLVFGLFFCSMVLMASLSLWVFVALEMAVATAIYFVRFYRYEPSVQ